MSATSTTDTTRAREAMVDAIVADHARLGQPPLSPAVEQALRTVPRHVFLPGLPLAEAYDRHQAVVTKEENGLALSSVSAPSIIATMLYRADLHPGQRVLEIGSGGYNASLVRELVGPSGQVTSIDIDPDVIARAEQCLAEAAVEDVHLAVADGEHGFAARAPFDRIIVTAGAWDLSPAWDAQLAPDGRLVVPMRVRGLTRCLTLERTAFHGRWRAVAVDPCGFVRMQGAGEHWEPMPLLHERDGAQVGLRLEDGPQADIDALRAALNTDPSEVWSGVTVGAEEATDGLDLFLASTADGWALLTAQRGAIQAGLIRPIVLTGTPALVDTDGVSFAYRILRRLTGQERWEFGAVGHGPRAIQVAQRLTDLISRWDGDHRGGPGPHIELFPASTPAADLPPGRVLTKRHTHTVLSWDRRPSNDM
ncbi:methyltransferase, FxLD system [Nocardiopsis sp. NPDC057823]|uniref:methyltransferase, FxLD system n=1 Tax=Nocardiopsis sp. NPDC057823 TaxID=3346256 RepID=UPI0036705A24